MKQGFRKSMTWLHTWSCLIVGWVLFFVFVTGTAGYFTYEINRWMEPERPIQGNAPEYDNGALALLALDRLEQVAPSAEYWSITLPHQSPVIRGWHDFEISWETMPLEGHEHGIWDSEQLDPVTGKPQIKAEPRATGGGDLLYRMHYMLHYIDYGVAIRIIGICSMLMLLGIVTGVIIHKKIFKDFFTFRPGMGQRPWLNAHSAISVMALPFFFMITYSGLIFFYVSYMPAGIAALYGTDQAGRSQYFSELYGDHEHDAITRPQASVPAMLAKAEAAWGKGQISSVFIMHDKGEEPFVEISKIPSGKLRWFKSESLRFHPDSGELMPAEPDQNATVRTHQTILALHEGRFADPWLRWLYFIAGLLGCGMIGTGLVLWTVKRRVTHQATGGHFGLRLVEVLNVATIAGLPAAVAAYFWANRLLPVEMADRAAWEAHIMFLVWGEILLYAWFRDTRKAWVEVLWLAAAAFALLPLLNALTTQRHLGLTLPAGDWVLAGFDFTVLALGLIFAYMAVKVNRRWLRQAAALNQAAQSATPVTRPAPVTRAAPQPVKEPQHSRWHVASRVLAAVLAGYTLTSAITVLLAQLWPLPQAQAVMASTMLSFAVYAGVIVWIFSVNYLRTVWLGLIGTTAVCACISWLMLYGNAAGGSA